MALLTKIRVLLWCFIVGLVLSGVTAIPLVPEVNWLVRAVVAGLGANSWLTDWLIFVQGGLIESSHRYPFLFYGTDWLAFGHFVIAIAFIGPIRDPVKNIWVVEFGMIASALVIPYALIFGAVRGVPFEWRLIDCSFGVLGLFATCLARHWIKTLEASCKIDNCRL